MKKKAVAAHPDPPALRVAIVPGERRGISDPRSPSTAPNGIEDPDLADDLEVKSRLAWIRWASATRFGRRPVAGFPSLAVVPDAVDHEEARRLFFEACTPLDHTSPEQS